MACFGAALAGLADTEGAFFEEEADGAAAFVTGAGVGAAIVAAGVSVSYSLECQNSCQLRKAIMKDRYSP